MARCNVCGLSAGLQQIHPACEALVQKVGIDAARGKMHVDLNNNLAKSLYASTRSLPVLAALLFPFFIIFGAVCVVEFFGAKDDSTAIIGCIIAGALLGLLFSSLIYTWFNMQSLLARRIAIYLDNHDF